MPPRPSDNSARIQSSAVRARATQRKGLIWLVRDKEWSAAGSHVLFLKSDWLGFSLKELLCILQKGALSEMDTWLMEHFVFAFLPSQPPVLLQSLWVSLGREVHAGKPCGVLCLSWSAEQRRGGGMAVLQLQAPAACHLSLVLSGLLEFALPVTAAS